MSAELLPVALVSPQFKDMRFELLNFVLSNYTSGYECSQTALRVNHYVKIFFRFGLLGNALVFAYLFMTDCIFYISVQSQISSIHPVHTSNESLKLQR